MKINIISEVDVDIEGLAKSLADADDTTIRKFWRELRNQLHRTSLLNKFAQSIAEADDNFNKTIDFLDSLVRKVHYYSENRNRNEK